MFAKYQGQELPIDTKQVEKLEQNYQVLYRNKKRIFLWDQETLLELILPEKDETELKLWVGLKTFEAKEKLGEILDVKKIVYASWLDVP